MPPEKDSDFTPDEFVDSLDLAISKIASPRIGFFCGMIYAHFTTLLAFFTWIGLTYVMATTEAVFTRGVNISAIAFTIGTFVLIAASNLADHYDKQHLNFRGYIHNSITFISAGIAFMVAFIYQSFVLRSIGLPFQHLLSYLYLLLVAIGSLLLTLSTWVLLKLLWRLNQLIKWDSDYELDRPIYGELTAIIGGFYYGLKMSRSDLDEINEKIGDYDDVGVEKEDLDIVTHPLGGIAIRILMQIIVLGTVYLIVGWSTLLKVLLAFFLIGYIIRFLSFIIRFIR